MRQFTIIDFQDHEIRVEFDVRRSEPDIGINHPYTDDHTLHDPDSGERMIDVERFFTESQWLQVREATNSAYF